MKLFLFFLKTLLYGWVVALIELLRILCRLLKRGVAASTSTEFPRRTAAFPSTILLSCGPIPRSTINII